MFGFKKFREELKNIIGNIEEELYDVNVELEAIRNRLLSKDSLKDIQNQILELKECLSKDFFELNEIREKSIENMQRFNVMINEFKGVLSQCRADMQKEKKTRTRKK